MNKQMCVFDYYGKPDYKGSRDEIVRYSIENRFTNSINLSYCSNCNNVPIALFQSCTEYFIKCPVCGIRTKMYKHLYEAKHAWNKGELDHVRKGKMA